MKYIIIPPAGVPFITNWYDYDNHYQEGMTIINWPVMEYSNDGKTFQPMETDHL